MHTKRSRLCYSPIASVGPLLVFALSNWDISQRSWMNA